MILKNVIKALAVFLAVVFSFSALVVTVCAVIPDEDTRETFRFGYYPQKEETDPTILKALEKATPNADGSVTYEGATYVSQRVEGNSIPGGGPFATMYGYYPKITYWFKMAPIEWIVLEKNEESMLLFSKQVLAARAFNQEIGADNTWGSSDVRTWLNNVFIKAAFTGKERAFILNSNLKNEGNPISYMEGSADTTDKVFLPSFNEITDTAYGFNPECEGWVDDFGRPVGYYEGYYDRETGVDTSGRLAEGTDFAKCQGVWANFEDSDDEDDRTPERYCRYWLRTVGWTQNCAAGVLEDGRVSTGWSVNTNIMGIRPMVRVSADAVLDTRDGSPDPGQMPFNVTVPAAEIRYKQKGVQFTADVPVTWSSSDESIASISEDGTITTHRAGKVVITATSIETGETVSAELEIVYVWWQQIIRIVLLGFLWY